jgi:nucleoid-associated protein YgaU
MPVGPLSRYAKVPVAAALDADGVERPTIGIRPQPAPAFSSRTHIVKAGETFEYLAWLYYKRSDAWWRIADANPRVFPHQVEPGMSLLIPSGDAVGRVERTRRF